MARKLFGTDGVRGRANAHPMTAETALRLGMAAARRFRRSGGAQRALIGKDTRLSGYMLESALQAGFTAGGMDVFLLGPAPTPAVGMLTRSLRADVGVMISASHNPYEDNGLKLFGPDGYKLSDDQEVEIEALMDGAPHLVDATAIGRARRLSGGLERYIEAVKASFPRSLRLDGMKIVVDCANGAAYRAAPTALWELGATVIAIGVAPDGVNINAACGSTTPQTCADAVVAHGADIGIALDGDADRLILIDERGAVVDGDQIMALMAARWMDSARLEGGAVVATIMSNMGLERWLTERGAALLRTQVGDRYVIETMRARRCNVGGEQSGHLVLRDFATTGDGLLAALQSLAAIVEKNRPASEVLALFQPLPQMMRSVRVAAGSTLVDHLDVRGAIAEASAVLGERGRLVVRPSGTEPVVRVMAEGDDETVIADVVASVTEALIQAGAATAAS